MQVRTRRANPVTTTASYSRAALSLYTIPPHDDISMEEFEQFAIDRLKVLKALDEMYSNQVPENTIQTNIQEKLDRFLPMNFSDPKEEDIRKDIISHFTLRLVYCRPDDREFLQKGETRLLKMRLRLSKKGIKEFMQENGMEPPAEVPSSEFQKIKEALLAVIESQGAETEKFEAQSYFKVKWTQVPDLVSHRKVLVRAGVAYLSESELESYLITKFRLELGRSMAKAYKTFPELKNDARIKKLIEDLPKQYLGREYIPTQNNGQISPEDLDDLAKISMPLCMSHCHTLLRRDHHLKHQGRLQYSLFLKAIGLTLEQSLAFWRQELETRGGRNFDKDYAYNIKHSYGTVGQRKNYTPYACNKIMGDESGVSGCPFKFYDRNQLKGALQARGIEADNQSLILKLVEERRFTSACARVFEASHVWSYNAEELHHPNRYFDESRKVNKKKENAAAQRSELKNKNLKTNAVNVPIKQETQ